MKIIRYQFLSLALLCIGCATAPPYKPIPDKPHIDLNNAYYTGEINAGFVENLQKYTTPNETIIISSGGGQPLHAIQAAKIIQERKLNLIVIGNCLSACAEYLLPAAENLQFIGAPVVGFHWDVMLLAQLTFDFAKKDLEYCDEFVGVKVKQKLYRQTGHNTEFWKQVRNHINVKRAFFYYPPDNKCPVIQIPELEKPFWFPNSSQLKNQLWLKFEGEVCADIEQCYAVELDNMFAKGTILAVANSDYISTGRRKQILKTPVVKVKPSSIEDNTTEKSRLKP